MTEPTPLYFTGDWSRYKDTFRRAKQKDPNLASIQLLPTEGFAGCQRLLAFGSPPPFVAEYALIRKSPQELGESGLTAHLLRWYLGQISDGRTVDYAGWLSNIFGGKVVEIG